MNAHFLPAFPGTQYAGGVSPSGHSSGMSLRDYFAAAALSGMCAADVPSEWTLAMAAENFAKNAYVVADAMLAERAKP